MNSQNSITMYKLIRDDWTSYKDMKWEIRKTNKATGDGNSLCTNDVLHCYASPLQAVFFAPRQGVADYTVMIAVDCSEIIATDGFKYGCKEQTPIKQIPMPELSLEELVYLAILFVSTGVKKPSKQWEEWARNWVSGEDRSKKAAKMVAADAAVSAATAYADVIAYTDAAVYADAYTADAYAAATADAAADAAYAAAHAYTDAAYASANVYAAHAAKEAAYISAVFDHFLATRHNFQYVTNLK